MRRTFVVIGLMLFPLVLEAQADPFLVRVRGYAHSVRLDTGVIWTTVSGTPKENFVRVLQVLQAQGIPFRAADSLRLFVQHPSFTVRGRLAGARISRWLSCGRGMSGEYADNWLVNLAYAVQLTAVDGGTRLGVSMAAGASDVEGASKPPLSCGTTGRFEKHLAGLVELER